MTTKLDANFNKIQEHIKNMGGNNNLLFERLEEFLPLFNPDYDVDKQLVEFFPEYQLKLVRRLVYLGIENMLEKIKEDMTSILSLLEEPKID